MALSLTRPIANRSVSAVCVVSTRVPQVSLMPFRSTLPPGELTTKASKRSRCLGLVSLAGNAHFQEDFGPTVRPTIFDVVPVFCCRTGSI